VCSIVIFGVKGSKSAIDDLCPSQNNVVSEAWQSESIARPRSSVMSPSHISVSQRSS
jgi:hypothetical protein